MKDRRDKPLYTQTTIEGVRNWKGRKKEEGQEDLPVLIRNPTNAFPKESLASTNTSGTIQGPKEMQQREIRHLTAFHVIAMC